MNGRKIPAWVGTGTLLALAIAPALTQDGQGATETMRLDEIVLTGEKQARSVKHTASSVAILTARDLEENGGQDSVADAATGIANVTYVASGGQGGAPTIRGQDSEGAHSGAVAFFGGTAPRLAFTLDGHSLGYNEIVWGSQALWDVESIEVFRGPQTATQGANFDRRGDHRQDQGSDLPAPGRRADGIRQPQPPDGLGILVRGSGRAHRRR
ncbi:MULTISPECIES: TonB-dependent receptor plug domain-containing protein [Paracoccus]|uniref:TonB-dependent receptor plug domain-containing protein n=1 Tax=Paracoccus TaxID=265 RepID=UPI000E24392A|nr:MULTISPECIES: Plug domain-containing protein [Paracoccus]WGR56967.1 Plug domain-containing protein [Paracoccus versutus]